MQQNFKLKVHGVVMAGEFVLKCDTVAHAITTHVSSRSPLESRSLNFQPIKTRSS